MGKAHERRLEARARRRESLAQSTLVKKERAPYGSNAPEVKDVIIKMDALPAPANIRVVTVPTKKKLVTQNESTAKQSSKKSKVAKGTK